MKTLLISDIHANIYALEAIWKQESDCDRILCAGDLVDYGFFPCETIAWVRAHGVECVQGNHDRWVAETYRSGAQFSLLPQPERTWAHYNASLLNQEEIEFLESLPVARLVEIDGVRYGITHMYREYQEIVSLFAFDEFRRERYDGVTGYEPESAFPERLIFGHTHRQSVRYLSDRYLWLNPGSASYRRVDDPDQTAHYAIFIDGRISLRRVAYDIEPLHIAARAIPVNDSEMAQAERYFGSR